MQSFCYAIVLAGRDSWTLKPLKADRVARKIEKVRQGAEKKAHSLAADWLKTC